MGDNILGPMFDPIGEVFAGGPFWSSDNSKFSGDSGGSGRVLSPEERRLIDAQVRAFDTQQQQQGIVFHNALQGFNDINRQIPGFQANVGQTANQLTAMGNQAAREGIDRRTQLEQILAGQPGDINALRNTGLSPDIGRDLMLASGRRGLLQMRELGYPKISSC